jgi:hypothetical protein
MTGVAGAMGALQEQGGDALERRAGAADRRPLRHFRNGQQEFHTAESVFVASRTVRA